MRMWCAGENGLGTHAHTYKRKHVVKQINIYIVSPFFTYAFLSSRTQASANWSQCSDSDEFQIYFGLPYIPKPHLKSQYAHIFTTEFKHKIQTRMLRFLKMHTDRGSQSSQKQKELIDQLTKKTRRQDSEVRKLEEDYGNILQLSLELMDLLQASVQGEPVSIGTDIFERLSARLISRPTTAISVTSRAASTLTPASVSLTSIMPPPQVPPPPVLSIHQPIHQQQPVPSKTKSKYDFDRIKHDMTNRGELLQALR